MADEVYIEIKSNRDEVESVVAHKIVQGLLGCGEAAEGFAQDDCPVDTGNLKKQHNLRC